MKTSSEGGTRHENKLEGNMCHEDTLLRWHTLWRLICRQHTPWKQTCKATCAMQTCTKQQRTTINRKKPAYNFGGRNRIMAGHRSISCSLSSWKSSYQNVRRNSDRNFGHNERCSETETWKKHQKGTLNRPLGAWRHNRAIISVEGTKIFCSTPMGIMRVSRENGNMEIFPRPVLQKDFLQNPMEKQYVPARLKDQY